MSGTSTPNSRIGEVPRFFISGESEIDRDSENDSKPDSTRSGTIEEEADFDERKDELENDVIVDDRKQASRTASVSSTGSEASPVVNMLAHHRRLSSESSIGSSCSRKDSGVRALDAESSLAVSHDGKDPVPGHRRLSPSLSDVAVSASPHAAQGATRGPKSPEMGSLSSIKKSRSMSADSPLVVGGECTPGKSGKTLTKPGLSQSLLSAGTSPKQALSRSVSSSIDERTWHSANTPSPLALPAQSPGSSGGATRFHPSPHYRKHKSRHSPSPSSTPRSVPHGVMNAPSGVGAKIVAERGVSDGHKIGNVSSTASVTSSPEMVFGPSPNSAQGELVSRAVAVAGKHRHLSGEMKRSSSLKRMIKSSSHSSLQVGHLCSNWKKVYNTVVDNLFLVLSRAGQNRVTE